MKELKERILRDGRALADDVLKVDSFINHQIDPLLMERVAEEFQRRFAHSGANKILTVEASGIAPAILLGRLMQLPVLFAKKQQPSTMGDFYISRSYSFTKQKECNLIVGRSYLTPEDRVLFIDDFLALGSTGMAVIDLCAQAGAQIVGMGFIIEKGYQGGHRTLLEAGVTHIESLAVIDSQENGQIRLR